MSISLRALIVEDSEEDCELLLRALHRGGFEVDHQRAYSSASLQESLKAGPWDVVISDYSMPGFSGIAALKIIRDLRMDVPFIFVSGTIGEDVAVEAMKLGAHDYVMKGNLTRLLPAIRRELEDARLRREHKEAEQRMRQLEKFEAIGQLAGGIAHDFNNVIGAIQGWAQLGLDESQANNRASKYFQSIRDQSQRAADLTRQLLAYARRQVLEPRNTDLNRLVSETVALLRRVIGAQIEVKLDLASEPQITRTDPAQIEQVLMNLCLNARDAMPNGGRLNIETSTVQLDASFCAQRKYLQPGEYILLVVSDTGTGMDEATQARIFEPFFTTKEVGKGTGLGLATVFGIVKQHSGAIEVESKLGRGTAFRVYLPASHGAPEAARKLEQTPIRGGDETLLLAEDNEGLREMIREVLGILGYNVIVALDGADAVEQFKSHSAEISLIVMDFVMPQLNGPDAYARIAQLKPGVPVIFMSGHAEAVAMPDSLKAARPAVLQKPFDRTLLARTIRELLDFRPA
ncbi:MAG TPA: response regulator [Candidatus Acidoferrales bacterium]|nr:response regulator [Candidatus Acidoferrales bacterium]